MNRAALPPTILRGYLPLAVLGCLLFLSLVSLTGRARAPRITASDLLEIGAAKPPPPSSLPSEIKIISYNMRWRGGADLSKLINLLRDDAEVGRATIIGLQEADRYKKRTNYANTARVMAEALGMNYAWAAPPRASDEAKEDETGVVILSEYPLTNVRRIVLPHEGPGGRRRVGLGATVRIGQTEVRVYSVHAETRIPVEKKMDQLRAVLEDIRQQQKVVRAVVLGDFNTIKGKDVRAANLLFTNAGFATPLPPDRATWKTFIIELKLDWIWLRGLHATESGITRRIDLSDHWPLWVKAKL